MAMFVHLTPAKNVAAIHRAGIKPGKLRFKFAGDQRGIFALPMTSNRVVTHQWLRELRWSGQREYCAVSFRIPDDEIVWIGFYNQPHA